MNKQSLDLDSIVSAVIHKFRHTAALRLGDAGADAFTLAAIFGWSDILMG